MDDDDVLFRVRCELVRVRAGGRLFEGAVRYPRIGKYEILEELGAGAMGVVFLARDPELWGAVALKLLRATDRADREAKALVRVSHEHVVRILDFGTFEDRRFIVMELIKGQSFRAWLETERPVSDILRVLADAGRGLKAVHDAGLVHRDFKPANVMVAENGRAKVVDFGLVRDTDNSQSTLTQTGMVVGAPAYMPREQLAGQQVDQRADRYAFCVTICEALTGRRERLTSDVGLSRRFVKLINQGCAEDPAARPSMEALISAVERETPPRHRRALFAAAAALAMALVVGLTATTVIRRASRGEDAARMVFLPPPKPEPTSVTTVPGGGVAEAPPSPPPARAREQDGPDRDVAPPAPPPKKQKRPWSKGLW